MAPIYQPGAQAKSGATFRAGGALPYEQGVVMPGLVPGIHVLRAAWQGMDGRDNRLGHEGEARHSEQARDHGSTLSRPNGPSFVVSFAPWKSKGAGKAGRRLAPAGPCATEMHTVWTTGVPKRPAFPARMVLTVSFVLSPGSDALLPPSPCGWLMRGPGRAATSPQDLTHRLRASGPHDFSVRGRPHLIVRGWRVLTPMSVEAAATAPCRAACVTAHGVPPCHHTNRADAAASTAARPHFVTIAKRPFDGPR